MRVLRNTENDRIFPFSSKLAKESWIEILHLPDGTKVPEVISEFDKEQLRAMMVSKESLPKDSYEEMHWTKVKKMVEGEDGRWTNVKEGIAFLRAMDKQRQSESAATVTFTQEQLARL